MYGHVTFLLSQSWYPGEYFGKFFDALDNGNKIYDTLNNYQKSMVGYMETARKQILKISGYVENSYTTLEQTRASIQKYLPTLDTMKTEITNVKKHLNTMKTSLGSISETIWSSKLNLDDINKFTASLPDIGSDISLSKGYLSTLKTGISDIQTKIASYLPKLGKLEKLDSLTNIETEIKNLGSKISSLDFDFDLSEIEVKFDDVKLLGEMKNQTSKLDDLIKKYDDSINKLGVLNNINDNLINMISLEQYKIDLLSQNMPIAQEFFNATKRLIDINNLGIQMIQMKITPLDYIDQFQSMLSKTYSLAVPKTPEFEISKPESKIIVEDFMKKEIVDDGEIIDTFFDTDKSDLIVTDFQKDIDDTGVIGAYQTDEGEIITVAESSLKIVPEKPDETEETEEKKEKTMPGSLWDFITLYSS